MAQKIAPIALRLDTNKHFDASWFGDRKYGSLLHQTLQLKSFIQLIFEGIGSKTALSHVQSTPHTLFVQSFFCTPRVMNQRMRKKQVLYDTQTEFLPLFGSHINWQSKKNTQALFALCMANHSKDWNVFKQYGIMHMILATRYHSLQKQYKLEDYSINQSLHLLNYSKADLESRKKSKKESNNQVSKYATHIETVLARYSQKKVVWTPYKMNKLFSSATFVAHYIALQFEQNKKKPFRSIFQDVLKQCVKLPHIVGVRIAIAGRINGAEMARVETSRYGQTSLHVFSHAIDYHATAAYTPHGLLGIKVWISFKHGNVLQEKKHTYVTT